MTTPGEGERRLTGDEYEALLPAFAALKAVELSAAFMDELPPGVEFGWVMEAMTRPAPGYREIANEGGIRWHARIAEDGDDDPR